MNHLPDELSGSVERITFYNQENGYTVLRLKPDSKKMLPFMYGTRRDQLITVVGNLPELTPGEWVKMKGKWSAHAKHGTQFQAEMCEQSLPATAEGVKRYLGSGLIRGVGKVMAERIVNHFGESTLDIIEENPERLDEVSGIGKKRVAGIIKAWEEQRAIKEVMLFLQSHGVSTNLATKIFKKYGDDALMIVQNTPYRLVQDVHGIGFKTADKIAQALGLAHDDPGRIEAGIAYSLNQKAQEGHVYLPEDVLLPGAAEILEVREEQVAAVLHQLENSELVKRELLRPKFMAVAEEKEGYETAVSGDDEEEQTELLEEKAVYLTPFYYAEIGATNRLQKLLAYPTSRLAYLKRKLTHAAKVQSMAGGGMQLAAQQIEGIFTAVQQKVTVLTGGPGTGKTTTLRTLLDLLDGSGASYLLASPTGRAAKRLSEATGREAKTLHRLLEFQPAQGFARNEESPLDADMIVIDEVSMLDLLLFNSLLKAIGPDTHLLLVGDVDQLPSVGAGDILRDLIRSGVVAVVRLQTIFRQAADSGIIQNAHRINQWEMIKTATEIKDFFLFVKKEPEEAAELLVDIVQRRIPEKFKLDGMQDIQVLSPMYNGVVGVANLNKLLQEALNPRKRQVERSFGGRIFRVGDKVMQIVNNYDKSVYNGDIGFVVGIDLIQQTVAVQIDGQPVSYDFLEMDELVHAYAVSVHKSQGAEYPCVVIPLLTQHYMMLQRNLLYTAVTRAKRLVVLVGTKRAIHIAVNNQRVSQRYTALDYRLQKIG